MSWLTWPWRALAFLVWFAWQVVVSNLTVVRDNLTPGQDSTPGVLAFDTRCRTDAEITVLGSLITLTPGTLTLGTAPTQGDGPRVLYVHGMYHEEADGLRAELREIEEHMLHAMRREGGES